MSLRTLKERDDAIAQADAGLAQEPAHVRAAGVISGGRVRALEAHGLAVFDANELANLRAALGALAEAVEFHTELAGPSPDARAALDFAWAVLGDEEHAAARLRAGCCQCGGEIDSPEHDCCARCAGQD